MIFAGCGKDDTIKELTVNLKHWPILAGALSIAGVLLVQSVSAVITPLAVFEDDDPAVSSIDTPDTPKAKDVGSAVSEDTRDNISSAETAKNSEKSQSSEKDVASQKTKRELTKNETTLRDQVRQTLSAFRKQPFNSRQNTVCDILDFCLAYGCDTEISLFDASGERRANGITCLCWNYPLGGFEPLTMLDGHIAARVGYGMQSQPSQFLATLAFSRVQSSYPLRVEKTVRTVADLVESEKRSCRAGSEMSLKLIGLAYFADDAAWKNDLGEEWTLEKIVREELNRPADSASDDGMNRLLALAYTNARREKKNLPIEGNFSRAEKYLGDFRKFAFNLQNTDGSWGYYLSARGSNNNAAAGLRSTACVLEWLTFSLPEEQLADPHVAAAANYVVQGLNSQHNRSNLPVLPSKEINTVARALHALSTYDERYFRSADEEKTAVEKSAEKTAGKPTATSSPTRVPSAAKTR